MIALAEALLEQESLDADEIKAAAARRRGALRESLIPNP